MYNQEVWKNIPGYEGIYQASSFGRIKSVEGKTTHSTRHGERHWHERILKPKGCQNQAKIGYRVSLWKDKKSKDYLVARLVAVAFLGEEISTKLTVNHKDGDRLNNHIDNLEWLSLSDNIKYGFSHSQFPQAMTMLVSKSSGNNYEFRSMSLAGKFLGRNSGYISNCLQHNRCATSVNGEKYFIECHKYGGGINNG